MNNFNDFFFNFYNFVVTKTLKNCWISFKFVFLLTYRFGHRVRHHRCNWMSHDDPLLVQEWRCHPVEMYRDSSVWKMAAYWTGMLQVCLLELEFLDSFLGCELNGDLLNLPDSTWMHEQRVTAIKTVFFVFFLRFFSTKYFFCKFLCFFFLNFCLSNGNAAWFILRVNKKIIKMGKWG